MHLLECIHMKIQEITSKAKQHVLENKKVWMISAIVLVCVLIIGGVVLYKKNVSKKNALQPGECLVGDKYSIVTGEPCPGVDIPPLTECAPGDIYSIKTGKLCEGNTENPVSTESAEISQFETVSEAPVKPASAYELARQEYKGKVLSYNEMCQATPTDLTVAPDSVVMIANDSSKTHAFVLAGKTTSLTPYHYDLIYIGSANTYKVTCDGADAGSVVAK